MHVLTAYIRTQTSVHMLTTLFKINTQTIELHQPLQAHDGDNHSHFLCQSNMCIKQISTNTHTHTYRLVKHLHIQLPFQFKISLSL